MILTPLQKLPKHVAHLGKIIVATGFEWLPKVLKIAKSGHTALTLMNFTEVTSARGPSPQPTAFRSPTATVFQLQQEVTRQGLNLFHPKSLRNSFITLINMNKMFG